MARIRTDPDASSERKASEWLSTLYIINDMLKQVEADGLHIEVILPRVLDLAVRQLEAHDGSIIVVNQDLRIEHAWLTDQESDPLLEEILERGVGGWVIQNKHPVLIDDTSQDERWFPHPVHTSTAEAWSVLCTPFIVRDRAIGAITLHKPGRCKFDEQDLDLLFTISSQAASTIENARLYEEMQRQLQISDLLNEASRVINSSLDINEIMQSLLTQMNEFLNAEAISIALVDKQTNELVYKVAEGIGSAQIVNLRLPSNLGLSGWVMEHAEPVLVPDTSKDHRFHRLGDRRTGHDTRAMICAPIQFQGEVLGTIQAINPVRGNFTDKDLKLLVNLANIASSAVANAQQFARIQEAESRYLSLFHGSVDPVIITDLAGKIVEVNQRAIELLGFARQELLSKFIQDLHPSATVLPEIGSIEGDDPQVFTSQLIASGNPPINVRVHAKQVQFGDQELVQWIHHDISKQIELEEMRQDLTAMLFHDLQSPLSNVIASLELLIDEVPKDIDPAFPAMLDIAMRSSHRLQTLIRSLLDINILEAGLPLGERCQVSIVKLIDDVEEIEKPSLEKRGVTLVRRLDGELPDLYVEEDMIRRVLVNLIDNALRYSETNHSVTVRATADSDDPSLMRIAVRDQGIGIPEQYHQTIFNKWERGQTNPSSGGLGLGLAFCRLAVEAHGGRIWVENANNGGARFSFTLPFMPDPE